MATVVKWQGGMAFKGTTESGHDVLMDAAPEVGGETKALVRWKWYCWGWAVVPASM